MNITLKPGQEAWLEAHVAAGDFASIEDAVQQLVDEGMVERVLGDDVDLAWAKPYVDEGLAELERGAFISLDDHKSRNIARLAALRR